MTAPAWVLALFTIIGIAAILVGAALYDVRLSLIVAGVIMAAAALLLVDVDSDTE